VAPVGGLNVNCKCRTTWVRRVRISRTARDITTRTALRLVRDAAGLHGASSMGTDHADGYCVACPVVAEHGDGWRTDITDSRQTGDAFSRHSFRAGRSGVEEGAVGVGTELSARIK